MLEVVCLKSRVYAGTIDDISDQPIGKEGRSLAMVYEPETDALILVKDHSAFDVYALLAPHYLEATEDARKTLADQMSDWMKEYLEEITDFLDEICSIRKTLKGGSIKCQ